MVFKKFINGEVIDANETNANNQINAQWNILNLLRAIKAGVVVFSKGSQDMFGDSYVLKTGRLSSVTIPSTISVNDALYDSTNLKYVPGIDFSLVSGDTLHTVTAFGSWSNTSYPFDTNPATAATVGSSNRGYGTSYIGKTFSSRYISTININATATWIGDGAAITKAVVTLDTYNGSTWTNVKTLAQSAESSGTVTATFNGIYQLNSTVQGIRIGVTGGRNNSSSVTYGTVYTCLYGPMSSYSTLEMTIPTGTFSSTISSSIGTSHIADWETGADIQYKLTNATEDSGYLSCSNTPAISTFTAFTSEPTKLIVKLIPKSSSPTSGYPAIYGFGVFAN